MKVTDSMVERAASAWGANLSALFMDKMRAALEAALDEHEATSVRDALSRLDAITETLNGIAAVLAAPHVPLTVCGTCGGDWPIGAEHKCRMVRAASGPPDPRCGRCGAHRSPSKRLCDVCEANP